MDKNEAKSILEACLYELSNQMGSEWCRKKYEAIQEAIKALEQPEIIRCKNCADWGTNDCAMSQTVDYNPDYDWTNPDGYCHMAERRTNADD